MIRLTDEQWERIRDHFPEENIADGRESARLFKGIICDDISEFESHMPSQAVTYTVVPGEGESAHRLEGLRRTAR
jgi:hypothetical protein